jgi:hypothetical protein
MNSNYIVSYWHCRMCHGQLPKGMAMARWARLSVGLTPWGLQVWCERHDAEVATVDFDRIDEWKSILPRHDGCEECELCRREAAQHGEAT